MKSLKLHIFVIGFVLLPLCSSAWAAFPTLSYDTVTAGTISTAAQTNTYTFSANANDILDFTVVTTSSTTGTLWPCIQVSTYPAGTPVTNGGSCPGGTNVGLNGVTIPSAGTYSLSVKDYNNANTGNYDVFLQRTDGPVGDVPLPLDQVQTGNIAAATQSNSYTFSANANDVFNFTVVTTSSTKGTLWPCIQVYNSAGAPVANGGSCPGGTNVGLNGLTITSAGTYSVIIKDYNNTNTGNYNIFLQRTDGPPNAITLPYDTVTAGTISAAAQTNNYTFAVNANDILNFTVVTTSSTSGTLWPCIQVYNSAGTPVTKGGSCPGGTNVGLNGLAITSAGTYTLSVKDYNNANTGNYDVFLQRTDGPVGALMLPLGGVQTGNIGSTTQSNAYTFSANANDVFNFTVVTTSSTSGTLWPCIQVYNSAGTPVTNGGSCPGGTDVELNGVAVTSAGTYSVIVKDYNNTNTGNYNIFLQRTNNPAYPEDIVFDQVEAGTVSAVAQSNAYTFSGTANDKLSFTVVTTTGTLWPCIQIYNSAGATVPSGGSCPGGGTATLSGFAVPSTSTYFVIIKDYNDSRLGTYNMSVQCSGTCLLPVPTLTSISPLNALAGSGGFTLTANGDGFASVESNSVIEWNGNQLASTNFVNTGQLTGAIPASSIATAGLFPVTVFTPTPGGGTSNSILFTVNNPVPALTSISPTNTSAGAPAFTITLNGSNFVQGSSVQWNTNALATTYVSATQLTAQVPVGDVATSGPATVTVFNPAPGGGTSNGITFTVNPAAGTPVITWPALAAINYGNALNATQLNAKAALNGTAVAGTFVYTYICPSKSGTAIVGTVLPAGACILSAGFTPTSPAYTTPAPYPNPLTVNKVVPAITWFAPAAITTTTPLSATQLDAAEFWEIAGAKVPVSGNYAYSYVCPSSSGAATIGTLLPAGSCTLTVNFTPTDTVDYNNPAARTVPITVTAATGFTLAPSPGALSVVQGGSITDTITIIPANGFTGSVTLSASNLPSGVTYSFGTNPATSSSVLTLTATGTATVGGPVPVTITGTSGSQTASTTIALTVTSLTVLAPGITPAAGTYPAAQLVTLTDGTLGSTIYYTTNGSVPSPGAAGTTVYTVPFLVSTNETVNAIAVVLNTSSPAASAAYTFIGSPSALAEPATAISTPTATLNALVNTNGLAGSYLFQYGTSSATLTSTTTSTALPAAATAVTVSIPINGLVSGTTYYYQVVVTTAGGTSSGAVLHFTAN